MSEPAQQLLTRLERGINLQSRDVAADKQRRLRRLADRGLVRRSQATSDRPSLHFIGLGRLAAKYRFKRVTVLLFRRLGDVVKQLLPMTRAFILGSVRWSADQTLAIDRYDIIGRFSAIMR
jgi:hypothetical protein